MSSIADSDAAEVLAGLCGAVDALSELDTSALTRHDRLTILRDVETLLRRIPTATHGIVNELVAGHVPGQFGARAWAMYSPIPCVSPGPTHVGASGMPPSWRRPSH